MAKKVYGDVKLSLEKCSIVNIYTWYTKFSIHLLYNKTLNKKADSTLKK